MCLSKVIHGQKSARKKWLHREGWKVFVTYGSGGNLYAPYQQETFKRYVWKSLPKSYFNTLCYTSKYTVPLANQVYLVGFHFCRYKTDALYLAKKLNDFTGHWSEKWHTIKPIYFKDPTAYGIERDIYGHRSLVGVARQIFICDSHCSENKLKAFPNGVV